MAYSATVADGTTIFLDTGVAFTEIRGARNFSVGAPSKGKIDTTELRSSVKTFAGGKVEFGDVTFTLMFDVTETTHTQIESQANLAGSFDRIYVKHPGLDQFYLYVGYFGGLALSYNQDATIEAEVTFTLSAAPEYSTTAPTP